MSRPEDIPQDVWDAAVAVELARPSSERGYLGDIPNETAVLPVARAILAERERCAKVAANHFDLRHADKARFAGASIAAAIRKGDAP